MPEWQGMLHGGLFFHNTEYIKCKVVYSLEDVWTGTSIGGDLLMGEVLQYLSETWRNNLSQHKHDEVNPIAIGETTTRLQFP